jgi:hypothetical protein
MTEFTLCCYSFIPYPHHDPNPKFALGADVYAHIPLDKWDPSENHALAIWLDIGTQEWVVRKEYHQQKVHKVPVGNRMNIVMISHEPIKKFRDVYRGKDFQEALNQCTIQSHKYWGFESEWKACSHNYESWCCKKNKQKYAYRGE